MAYWIEVRCALQRSKACYSARQIHTPMEFTDTASMISVQNTITNLRREALSLGWVKQRIGFVCPECVKEG